MLHKGKGAQCLVYVWMISKFSQGGSILDGVEKIAGVRLLSITFEVQNKERNRTDSVRFLFPLLVWLSDVLTLRGRNNVSLIPSMI